MIRTISTIALFCTVSLVQSGCDVLNVNGDEPQTGAGTSFVTARLLRFDSNGKATIAGVLSEQQADVFDLGPMNPGDHVIITVNPAMDSRLDPVIGLFDQTEEFIAFNDDVDPNAGQIGSAVDEIITVAGEHYYLAIARFAFDSNDGGYTGVLQLTRGGAMPEPGKQFLILNFDGGDVVVPNEGSFSLDPFDSGDIDDAYAGKTDEIRERIVEVVKENFEGTGLEVITSDDPNPGEESCSTLHFGGFSSTKFGAAQSVDQSNRNLCDDGIIYTDDFDKPFANQPDAQGIATAIGNVAAHEAGHLLGLNHVSDVDDLMDNTGSASTLLADQEFKASDISPSIFPFGVQNGPKLLVRVIPE